MINAVHAEMEGMFVCPVVDEAYVKEIGIAGPDATDDQVANAIRNCQRVCDCGIAPEFFVVDGKKFGTPRPIKGENYPQSYVEAQPWPYIIGKAGELGDLGDPGYLEDDNLSRIVGKISEKNIWYFVRADGSRRLLTEEENTMFNSLVDFKMFESDVVYDSDTGEYIPTSPPATFIDPILMKEIITGKMDT